MPILLFFSEFMSWISAWAADVADEIVQPGPEVLHFCLVGDVEHEAIHDCSWAVRGSHHDSVAT